MGAQVTVEDQPFAVIEWQVDQLGYTLCGDHLDIDRRGTIIAREAASVRRSAETDDREMWICETCKRHIVEWPEKVIMVKVQIEHTACRIF